MFLSVKEVYDWIYQQSPINDLNQFKQFLDELNHPENQFISIHVGGTNGKGSTVSYLASILKEANYKVGTFTTPYLHVLNDRIRVNGIMIPDDFIVSLMNTYYDIISRYCLSYHEIDMFIATMYFISMDVDIAIYEVGLGGRKDATNVITPILSVITNIGKDHMAYLGNTYESIAKEKAGIIKEKIPLFTSETKTECLQVFKETCQNLKTTMHVVLPKENKHCETYLSFKANDQWFNIDTLAYYQIKNASLVYECVLYLRNVKHLLIQDEAMIKGFWKASWPGRFEKVLDHPLMIIDGAHNLEGMDAFIESAQNFKDSSILFSALKDKEVDIMIDHLFTLSQNVILTSFEDERIANMEEIACLKNLKYIENYQQAIDELLAMEKTILVVGSLHFISKVRAYVFDKKGESTISRSMYGNEDYRN